MNTQRSPMMRFHGARSLWHIRFGFSAGSSIFQSFLPGITDGFARIMDLPDQPTNPQQIVLSKRQRSIAVRLRHTRPHFYRPRPGPGAEEHPHQMTGARLDSSARRRVFQPRLSDGVTNAQNALRSISTCQFLLVLDHPSRLLGASPAANAHLANRRRHGCGYRAPRRPAAPVACCSG